MGLDCKSESKGPFRLTPALGEPIVYETSGDELLAIAQEVQMLARQLPVPLRSGFFERLEECFQAGILCEEVVVAARAAVLVTEVRPLCLYRDLLVALRTNELDRIRLFVAHGGSFQ